MQIVISLVGIALMIAMAWMLSWYKQFDGRGPKRAPAAVEQPIAGGAA
jgi:hypothetical protein